MIKLLSRSRVKAGLAALVAFGALAATPASAEMQTFAAYMAPKHPFYSRALEPFVAESKADTNLPMTWRVVPGGQLLGARESLDGAGNGIANATFIVPVYNRTELPYINVLFQLIALGDNVVAGTGATLEAMYLHCPECIKDYTSHNTVPLATGSGGEYRMFCKDKVNTLADVKGRKIRAVGALARLVKMMGGTPLNLPANEGVTAIQRGTLDCLIGPLAWMTSYGYVDVAPNVLNVPMGYVKGLGLFVMNRDTWSGFKPETRKAMLGHMGLLSARSTILAYVQPDEELLNRAGELHLTVTKGDGSFRKLFKQFSDAEIEQVIVASEKSGAKNARQLVKAITDLYPKWEKIAETTGDDITKVGAAYHHEIYDKLDPKTFGVK